MEWEGPIGVTLGTKRDNEDLFLLNPATGVSPGDIVAIESRNKSRLLALVTNIGYESNFRDMPGFLIGAVLKDRILNQTVSEGEFRFALTAQVVVLREIETHGSETKVARSSLVQGALAPLLNVRRASAAERNYVYGLTDRGVRIGLFEDMPIQMPMELINRHVAVVGTTGSGKTRFAAALAAEFAAAGAAVVVIDVHGEYSGLLESSRSAPVKCFESGFANDRHVRNRLYLDFSDLTLNTFLDLIGDTTDLQRDLLYVAFSRYVKQENAESALASGQRLPDAGESPIAEFSRTVQSCAEELGFSKQTMHASLQRLRKLSYLGVFGRGAPYADLNIAGQVSVVSVTNLDSVAEELLVGTVVKRLLEERLRNRRVRHPFVLLIEEFHRYQWSTSHVARALVSYAREARKFGVGLILVSQRPSDIDVRILSQCNTFFAFRQQENSDVGIIAGRLGAFRSLSSALYFLPDRRAVAMLSGGVAPFIIEAPSIGD